MSIVTVADLQWKPELAEYYICNEPCIERRRQ